MEIKYFTPYRVLYIFGFINSFLLLIIYFIVSFIPCDNFVCYLEYDNKKYFDNIFSAFEVNIKIIIGFIFTLICLGVANFLIYYIIHKYTICHIFLFYICKEVYQLYLVGNEKILKKVEYNDFSYIMNTSNLIMIFLIFFECFFHFVFLEFIELNCCGLSENTKRNIQKRSIIDISLLKMKILIIIMKMSMKTKMKMKMKIKIKI